MKIAAFSYKNYNYVGVIDEQHNSVRPFAIESYEAEFGALPILEMQAYGMPLPHFANESFALSDITLRAPIPHPRRNIFCVGKNYLEHVKEVAKSGLGSAANNNNAVAPDYPIVFTKVPETVIADNQHIQLYANVTHQVDYEAELAVVIGKGGRGISKADAMEHVWGYTIINDVSARDLQKRHQQWHLAKSLDTFCPMGPWLVAKDGIDINNTAIKCWVNGELRQDGNTSQFIFDIATLIESISAGITLYPGDIIATGTPSGVGMGFTPPRFLANGDHVRIAIEGIGELNNSVVG